MIERLGDPAMRTPVLCVFMN